MKQQMCKITIQGTAHTWIPDFGRRDDPGGRKVLSDDEGGAGDSI